MFDNNENELFPFLKRMHNNRIIKHPWSSSNIDQSDALILKISCIYAIYIILIYLLILLT